MPLEQSEYVLSEEAERIDAELETLGEETVEYEPGTPAFSHNMEKQQDMNRYRHGLDWMVAEYGEETSVTLGALTPREYAQFETVAGPTDTDRRTALVAVGTLDAPYLKHDPDDPDEAGLQQTATFMGDNVHNWFIKWAESQINELLRGGERENPFWNSYVAAATETESE